MKKLLLITVFLLGLANSSFAQYDNAIGLRFGLPSGLSYKKFISEKNALEGILHLGSGLGGTVLYQIHAPAFNEPNLRWYYGFGGHGHIHGSNNNIPWRFGRNDNVANSVDLGLNGVIGLEYTIESIPVCVSLDASPILGFNSSGYNYFGTTTSLAVRYTF
jgi:hypothetical protein